MPRTPNLGISRRLAVMVAIGVSMIALAAIGVSLILGNVSAAATPPLATVLALFGSLTTGLVAALKATETADTASKTHDIVALTASQNATIQQVLMAHCGAVCPLAVCGLRDRHIQAIEGITHEP